MKCQSKNDEKIQLTTNSPCYTKIVEKFWFYLTEQSPFLFETVDSQQAVLISVCFIFSLV